MALIAKETLRIGFTVAALPGNVVSPSAVEEYGWQDKVEDDGTGEVGGSEGADTAGEAPAKRTRKSKAAAEA